MIEDIGAEVQDLHPLLKSVLGKLENIKGVEYTHGTQRKERLCSYKGLTRL